jgi:hypothetical protein
MRTLSTEIAVITRSGAIALVGFQVHIADIGVFASEALNNPSANAATATCDQCNFSRQSGHGAWFFVISFRSIHDVRLFFPLKIDRLRSGIARCDLRRISRPIKTK